MSFRLSFHLTLLVPTGAHWLDGPSDLSCNETTRQHAVDGSPLSCNPLPCQERPRLRRAAWLREGSAVTVVIKSTDLLLATDQA